MKGGRWAVEVGRTIVRPDEQPAQQFNRDVAARRRGRSHVRLDHDIGAAFCFPGIVHASITEHYQSKENEITPPGVK